MGRHKKVGRPKGSTKDPRGIVGCSKVHVYVRRKGRIKKIDGFKHKACID